MVQKIRGDQKTFAEVADRMMSIVLHEGTEIQCIGVVFDVKRDSLVKNAERDRAERLRKRSWIQKHQGRQQNIPVTEIPFQFKE